MMLEPVEAWPPFRSGDIALRIAAQAWELVAYRRLRRRVFCDEQRLFIADDHDAIDARATVLVAAGRIAGVLDDIIGGVRVWEASPGAWWGGRLVVHPAHRGTPGVASGLVRLAVATACRRGARTFRATVQTQNVAMFERLGWSIVEHVEVRGAPHALLAAGLARFGGGAA